MGRGGKTDAQGDRHRHSDLLDLFLVADRGDLALVRQRTQLGPAQATRPIQVSCHAGPPSIDDTADHRSALVFMVFWNYRLCVITPPGSVPLGWVGLYPCERSQVIVADAQRPNLSQMDGIEVKRGSHAPRYCKTCEHYKPPRSMSTALSKLYMLRS
jgi:hypothetical protein